MTRSVQSEKLIISLHESMERFSFDLCNVVSEYLLWPTKNKHFICEWDFYALFQDGFSFHEEGIDVSYQTIPGQIHFYFKHLSTRPFRNITTLEWQLGECVSCPDTCILRMRHFNDFWGDNENMIETQVSKMDMCHEIQRCNHYLYKLRNHTDTKLVIWAHEMFQQLFQHKCIHEITIPPILLAFEGLSIQ